MIKPEILIRPMAYCSEQGEIKAAMRASRVSIIPCNLCGTHENMQRRNIKEMLEQWDKEFPGRVRVILT